MAIVAVGLGIIHYTLKSPILLDLVPLETEKIPFFALLCYVCLFIITNITTVITSALFNVDYNNNDPRAQKAAYTGVVGRLHAAHMNTVEGLPVFLAGLYASRSTDGSSTLL